MAEKRLIWSPRASNELKDILEYYLKRNGSPTYSLKLLETVDAMINLLHSHPYLGRKTTDDEARVISFGHFLLFYDESEHELHILSVWDNRQDPAKRVDSKP